MSSSGPAAAAQKHRVPVIDRMMDVLMQLERRGGGATIRELAAALKLPRTTVYRILNTLLLHDMVRRDAAGTYQLGHRLLRLAAHVASSEVDLVTLAQPTLDRLVDQLGESAKLSVLDHDGVVVLAAAQGRRQYALTVSPGQRMDAHVGAAGKLLLAYLPTDVQQAWLERPMAPLTPRTVTDPKRLRAELARIRRLGWALDKGESAPSIQAFAAPVFDARGAIVATISVPFLTGTEAIRMEEFRLATIAAARALSAAIPGPLAR